MRNVPGLRKPLVYVTVTLFCFSLLWAQSKGHKPQPPPVPMPCNNDGICQYEERETANCGDCNPLKNYGTALDFSSTAGQVFTYFGEVNQDPRVYQYRYFPGPGYVGYGVGWASDPVAFPLRQVMVGDIDGDRRPEVVAMGWARSRSKGKYVYDQRFFIFREGSTGAPYSSTPAVSVALNPWRTMIADADSDGTNELIVTRGNTVELYTWSTTVSGEPLVFVKGDGSADGALHLKWASGDLGSRAWSTDVGDADNDGLNELVVARFQIGSAQIWKHQNGGWSSSLTQSLGTWNIDVARVRDVDGDGQKEIIAGGTIQTLAVWKHQVAGTYPVVFRGPDLGGYNDFVDAADIDGDGRVEVFTSGNITNGLFVFGVKNAVSPELYFSNLEVKYSSLFTGGCLGLSPIYNRDVSPVPGIASGINGFSIFSVVVGQLVRSFNSYYAIYTDVLQNP